jgi:ketosteroid isomerase-like protein
MRKALAAAAVVAVLMACIAGAREQADRSKDKAAIEQMVRDSIGWAITKDRALAERVIAHDPDLFMFNPDSKSTSGWDAFVKNFEFWMDPRFKATSFDVRDLRVTVSRSGDVAWYSAILDDLALWDGRPAGWKDTRWTGVLEKRRGAWVIVQMHFSFASDKPREGMTGAGPYLGQKPPGATPELFAPNLVSTAGLDRDIAIAPDGREIFFSVAGPGYQYSAVVHSRLVDGHWTEPEVVPGFEDPRHMSLEPALSADGNTLFFLSNRPGPSDTKAGNQDIWTITRTAGGWSEPRNLGAPVNSASPEYFPSVTRDGTLYFTREGAGGAGSIWRARLLDGRYLEPEKLPAQVNSGASQFNAFVAPDESYLIVPIVGRPDSIGGCDYYVVFREPDDRWSDPINLGDTINTPGSQEFSPYVSPDGKYFFFMSSRFTRPERLTYSVLRDLRGRPGNGNPDTWWVDAKVVTSLRARAVFPAQKPPRG